MIFLDPFSGGGNVAIAAMQLNLSVCASDIDPLWRWQFERSYTDVYFPEGSIVWLSPPCVNHSVAGKRSRQVSVPLSSNQSLANCETIIFENVSGYPFDTELSFLPEHRFFSTVIDLSLLGSCQNRKRLIGVCSKRESVIANFKRSLSQSSKPRPVIRAIENIRIYPDVRASGLSPDTFRMLHGSNTSPRSVYGLFPTFTKSAMSRPFAIAVNCDLGHGLIYSDDLVNLEGFPLRESGTAARVLGDGVPFAVAKKLIQAVL